MNGVATADVAAPDDNIDKAKLPLWCKNSIVNLDVIKDKYYQVKGNNKDDEFWNKDRNNRMIITDSLIHGINSSPSIWDEFGSII